MRRRTTNVIKEYGFALQKIEGLSRYFENVYKLRDTEAESTLRREFWQAVR